MSFAASHAPEYLPFAKLATSLSGGGGGRLSPSQHSEKEPPPFFAVQMAQRGALGRLLALSRPFLAEGGWLYCIDGCNGFAPQTLALMAAQFGEEHLLEQVLVSRAYTAHQLISAIKTLPVGVERVSNRACLAVLGYDHLFYADDIPLWERRHLHRRGIEAIRRRHRAENLPLLVTLGQGKESPWCRELLQASSQKRKNGIKYKTIPM